MGMARRRPGLLAVGIVLVLAAVSLQNSVAGAPLILDQATWAPATRTALQALIDRNGIRSPGYDPAHRPYAVFDWDNTAIMADTQEALFAYQLDHLAFKLTPEQFARAITKNVPPGPFAAACKSKAGQPVTLEAIVSDLSRDYTFLYQNDRGSGAGSRSLAEITATETFRDFKAKMLFLYDAISETYGAQVAYPWVLYLFAGMTPAEVRQLAEASNDFNLASGLSELTLTSPESMAGRAGVVEASHVYGIRLAPEIANLMHTFEANGIDVFVVTASLEDVVRVFAANPKYGYGVKPENVTGLRLELADGVYQAAYKAGWPLTVHHGKTEVIRREIAAQRGGRGPVLVAGDSSGDYEMMTEFPDTQLRLIVKRQFPFRLRRKAPGIRAC